MKAPPRLLDDPAIAPDLREDLRRAAEYTPLAYDAAAGLASLHVAIGGAPAAIGPSVGHAGAQAGAGATGAASTGAGISAAKLALIALSTSAAIAAGVATWPSARSVEHPAPAPAAHAKTSQPAAPAVQPALAPQPSEAAPESAPTPAVVPEPLRVPAHARADGDAALRGEVIQLRAIKAQLERDPARAYLLALAGQRRWKNGALAQEREGLIVLALWALDRHDEARAQARAFLDRYPSSPLRERLQPILAGAAP